MAIGTVTWRPAVVGTTGNLSPTQPTPAAGDLMLCFCYDYAQLTSWTQPAGWSTHKNVAVTASGTFAIFYKIAVGNEGTAAITCAATGTGVSRLARICKVEGAGGTAAHFIAGAGEEAETTSTYAHAGVDMTGKQAGCLTFFFGGTKDCVTNLETDSFGTPTGGTNQGTWTMNSYGTTGGSDAAMGIATSLQSAGGAAASITSTVQAGQGTYAGISYTFAVQPMTATPVTATAGGWVQELGKTETATAGGEVREITPVTTTAGGLVQGNVNLRAFDASSLSDLTGLTITGIAPKTQTATASGWAALVGATVLATGGGWIQEVGKTSQVTAGGTVREIKAQSATAGGWVQELGRVQTATASGWTRLLGATATATASGEVLVPGIQTRTTTGGGYVHVNGLTGNSTGGGYVQVAGLTGNSTASGWVSAPGTMTTTSTASGRVEVVQHFHFRAFDGDGLSDEALLSIDQRAFAFTTASGSVDGTFVGLATAGGWVVLGAIHTASSTGAGYVRDTFSRSATASGRVSIGERGINLRAFDAAGLSSAAVVHVIPAVGLRSATAGGWVVVRTATTSTGGGDVSLGGNLQVRAFDAGGLSAVRSLRVLEQTVALAVGGGWVSAALEASSTASGEVEYPHVFTTASGGVAATLADCMVTAGGEVFVQGPLVLRFVAVLDAGSATAIQTVNVSDVESKAVLTGASGVVLVVRLAQTTSSGWVLALGQASTTAGGDVSTFRQVMATAGGQVLDAFTVAATGRGFIKDSFTASCAASGEVIETPIGFLPSRFRVWNGSAWV